MTDQDGQLLAEIISAVGSPRFIEASSRAICAFSNFELSSVVLHKAATPPRLLFEDLGHRGYRAGIENYIHFTHRANPMLHRLDAANRIVRASDFRLGPEAILPELRDHLVPAPDEELGFRTVGWPERLEELGLYFEACEGIVELSVYRQRSRTAAPSRTLQSLQAIRLPLAAAFTRHAALVGDNGHGTDKREPLAALSQREQEVAQLLLAGCSSEAIALRLGIRIFTVKDHRKAIFRKMRVGSLAEFFALASRIEVNRKIAH